MIMSGYIILNDDQNQGVRNKMIRERVRTANEWIGNNRVTLVTLKIREDVKYQKHVQMDCTPSITR